MSIERISLFSPYIDEMIAFKVSVFYNNKL